MGSTLSRNALGRLRPTALLVLSPTLAAVAPSPAFVQAQERERHSSTPGPPVLELVTSTRALALGGAFWTPVAEATRSSITRP